MEAYLVLEDGTIFQGEALEEGYFCHGEVVFNTSMTGYQEILTDPSYCGQIVVMTYPLIGNYGVNEEDREAPRPQVQGLVAREICREPSNWRLQENLISYLKKHGVPFIQGVDTRALTRHLRSKGTMYGILTSGPVDLEEIKRLVREKPPLSGDKLVPTVTNSRPYVLGEGSPRVAVYNLGVKGSILEWFVKQGCSVIVFPAHSTAEEILASKPDGVVLSNGPGNPKDVPYGVETVKGLLGKVPILGICLGHQILALALGGDTFKLRFGHRGGNHPVKDLATGKVYITSQNHGYAVVASSLPPEEVCVSHINLNDDTVEGFRHKFLPVISVQYHPEAGPGPTDSEYIFKEFLELIQNR
ncbi:MAG: glutamine-hydrolyzing carbamoyl-phosphate synthase small subunit [Thermanaeromonas sp.]|uniref:glutamine-hydrolyzing carbamoyl-phosphate synthase small subunit n=1 Tax=Thermanaeromonas sp. TaxID=2003697 RepID=UPI00243F98F8|nr:glutamine-hydrolyzing carbamoyl-phosphate synthase small subunit [Thermanaeromonas sp.]MCG0276950.1 glutamine-hydrolyzing carbamoyl-phosphate synthase small subunit [Thermanaeromonas sp.]